MTRLSKRSVKTLASSPDGQEEIKMFLFAQHVREGQGRGRGVGREKRGQGRGGGRVGRREGQGRGGAGWGETLLTERANDYFNSCSN